jgi:hypothetical protein
MGCVCGIARHVRGKGMRRIDQEINVLFPHVVY